MNPLYNYKHIIRRITEKLAFHLNVCSLLIAIFLSASTGELFALTATTSGNWFTASTWGGTLPVAGDDILIPVGITVNVNGNTPIVNDITVNGSLTIPNFASANLTYDGNLQVGGTLTNNGGLFQNSTNKSFTLSGTGTYIHNPRNNTTLDESIFINSNESFSNNSHLIIQKWANLSVPLGDPSRVQSSTFGNVTLSVDDTLAWEQNGRFMTATNTQRVFGTFTVTAGIISMDNGNGGTNVLQLSNVTINNTGSIIFSSGYNRPFTMVTGNFTDNSTSTYPTIIANESYGLTIWTINGNATFGHNFYGVKGTGNNGGSDLRITCNGNLSITGGSVQYVYRANAPFQLTVAGTTSISGSPTLVKFIDGSSGNLTMTTNNFTISGGFSNILMGGGLYPYDGQVSIVVNNNFTVNGLSNTVMMDAPSNTNKFRLYVGGNLTMSTPNSNLTLARSKGPMTVYNAGNTNLTGGRFIGQQDTASTAFDSVYVAGTFTMNYGATSTDFFRMTYGDGNALFRTNGTFLLSNSNSNNGFGFVGKYGGEGNLTFYAQTLNQQGGRFTGIYGYQAWVPTGSLTFTIPLTHLMSGGTFRGIDNRFALNDGILTAAVGIVQYSGGNYSAVHTATGSNLLSTINITGICQITFTAATDTFMFIGHTQSGSVYNTMQLAVNIGANLNITGNNNASFISSLSSGIETINITGELNSSGGKNSFNSYPNSGIPNSHMVNLNVNSNMQVFGGSLYLNASSSGGLNATVGGNLNVSLGELVVTHANAPSTLNVQGGGNITGGVMYFHKNSSEFSGAPITVAINSDDDATGNFVHSGGTINFDNNPTSATAILDIYSPNVTYSGSGLMTMANQGNNFTLANINYRRTGNINFTRSGSTHMIHQAGQNVYAGCTLTVVSGDLQLASVNYFTINLLGVNAGGVLDLQGRQLFSSAIYSDCGIKIFGKVRTTRAQGMYDGTSTAAFNSNGNLQFFILTGSTIEYYGTANQVVTGIGLGTATSGFQKYSQLEINHQGTPNVNFAYPTNNPNNMAVAVRDKLILTAGELNLDNDHVPTSGGRSIVIENGASDAIVRTNGYIRSEVQDSTATVVWLVGSNSGSHIVPFGYNSTSYIPFNFFLPADNADTITVGTYHTAVDNTPYPPGVLHVKGAIGFPLAGQDNSANTVDRFWFLRVTGPAPNANLTFVCTPAEIGAIANPRAQCWIHYFPGGWQYPLQGIQSDVPNGTFVNSANYFPNNWWTLSGLQNPLPVTLLDFSGECKDDQVELQWITESEINNSHFTVSRSANGVDYEQIAIVNGSGTTVSTTRYQYTDRNAVSNSQFYYVLEQTDFDGKTETYGPIVVRSCSENGDLSISAIQKSSQNPDLLVNTSTEGKHLFRIFSMEGKPIATFERYLNAGQNLVEIRSINPSGALYIISVENETTRVSTKVPLGLTY